MSINILFIILASIIVIALLIYLIGIKKGKSQTSTTLPETPEPSDDDEEL